MAREVAGGVEATIRLVVKRAMGAGTEAAEAEPAWEAAGRAGAVGAGAGEVALWWAKRAVALADAAGVAAQEVAERSVVAGDAAGVVARKMLGMVGVVIADAAVVSLAAEG